MNSELENINGNKNVICCFGGISLKMGGIPPFEFLNYLSTSIHKNQCDLLFYIDKNQCCYHKGIDGISNNIEETVEYLNNKIRTYEKIIFMGVSAGGYASILFGSLCKNVTHVIGFIPKIKLSYPIDIKYSNLKYMINSTTQYILLGDKSINDINDNHHISQCEMLEDYNNVKILKLNNVNLKELRDNGVISDLLENILQHT
jgi:hypothetical protein